MDREEFDALVESVEGLDAAEMDLFRAYFASKVHSEYLAWVDELRYFAGEDFGALIEEASAIEDPIARDMALSFYMTHEYLYDFTNHHGDIEGIDERRLKVSIADFFFSRDLPRAYIIANLIEIRDHSDSIVANFGLVDCGSDGYMLTFEHRGGYLVLESVGYVPVPADEYLDFLTDPAYYAGEGQAVYVQSSLGVD
jgi:hypothetical protein